MSSYLAGANSMLFFKRKQSKLDAIHEEIYTRINEVSKNTAEASKSFDEVNELLEKGGNTALIFLASGGDKRMGRKS